MSLGTLQTRSNMAAMPTSWWETKGWTLTAIQRAPSSPPSQGQRLYLADQRVGRLRIARGTAKDDCIGTAVCSPPWTAQIVLPALVFEFTSRHVPRGCLGGKVWPYRLALDRPSGTHVQCGQYASAVCNEERSESPHTRARASI